MKYKKLGNSDLNVSRICMGCMDSEIPDAAKRAVCGTRAQGLRKAR